MKEEKKQTGVRRSEVEMIGANYDGIWQSQQADTRNDEEHCKTGVTVNVTDSYQTDCR